MTIDPFVLLAPVLLLAVVALLRFVGCNQVFGLDPTTYVPPTAITFRQLAENLETVNNAQVTTAVFAADPDAGNLMVVWIWYNSPAQSVSGVTDTAGNSYQRAVGPTPGAGTLAGWQQEILYAKNIIGGANFAVTASFSGSFNAEKAISAHEYQGADAMAPLVQPLNPLDPMFGTPGTAMNASIGPMTTAAAKLIFGAAIFQGSGSAAPGFSPRSVLQSNVTEDRAVASGVTLSATFNNAAQDWIAQLATFK